jgi:lipopolysaccharide export LptBFGC system permease protein LptF
MKKRNLVAPFVFVVLAVGAASVEPALAGVTVPGPIIGAGLPVLAALAGGYWLMRKFRS